MESLVYTNLNFKDEESLRAERVAFKKFRPNKCEYCGKTIVKWEEKTVDHKNPVARGGIDAPSNYCIACEKCNKDKANMTVEEFDMFRKITSSWSTELKDVAKSMVVDNIKENSEVDWSKITKENVMEKVIEKLQSKVDRDSKACITRKTYIFKVPTSRIVLAPIDSANQKRITPDNKKVQNTLTDYKGGVIIPMKVFKTEVSNGNYIYILLNQCSRYYAYKNILQLDEIDVECVNIEDLSKGDILNIISCVSGNTRNNLLSALLKKCELNVANPSISETDLVHDIGNLIDINLIKIPTSLANNLKMLDSDNRRVKNVVTEYNTLKTMRSIRVFNNIPLDNLYVFYAYKYVLKLENIKVINVALDELNKKERCFISSCVF